MDQPTVFSFAYKAQSAEGQPIAGTIESTDPHVAGRQLERMGVRVLEMGPASPRPARPLKAEDFHAFNLQLAQLTSSGLPLEQGLRLLAGDLRRGRLATAINEVAGDLEQGVPLPEAFERHRGRFPSLYGRLVDAGVRMGNLPGVLLSLGEHLELVQRLRAILWRVLSYPAAVLMALAGVLLLIHIWVQPAMMEVIQQTQRIGQPVYWTYRASRQPPTPDLSGLTAMSIGFLNGVPLVVGAVLGLIVLYAALGLLFRLWGRHQSFVDYLVLPIPLFGQIIRCSMLARWCHAVALAVESGQDLPSALSLASAALGSPRLQRDSDRLSQTLASGQSLQSAAHPGLLPATIPMAMEMGSSTGSLAAVMRNLSTMYRRQTEYRAQSLPAVLTPALLVLLGLAIGLSVVGLFVPLVSLLSALGGL